MKICIYCKQTKDLFNFEKTKVNKDGFRNACKDCIRKKKQEYYQKNKEEILMKQKDYKLNNKEKIADYHRDRYLADKENILKQQKDYKRNNKEVIHNYLTKNKARINFNKSLRRSRKLNATPKWLTEEMKIEINKIYQFCQDISSITGIEHHVDHIVPLKGKIVCGLHVPWNLQVIPASENLSKNNRLM